MPFAHPRFWLSLGVLAILSALAGMSVLLIPELRLRATEVLTGRPVPLAVGETLGPGVTTGAGFSAYFIRTSQCPPCDLAGSHLKVLMTELAEEPQVRFVLLTADQSDTVASKPDGLAVPAIAPLPIRRRLEKFPVLLLLNQEGVVLFQGHANFKSDGQALTSATNIRRIVAEGFAPK